MSLIKISERFVLNKLKKISQGNLKLINYDGKVFHFGDLESKLSSDIKINKPNFYLNVIMGGSSALGEAHMKKDFYSSNLTNLIELTARNINTIYSFSGSLKLQKIKKMIKTKICRAFFRSFLALTEGHSGFLRPFHEQNTFLIKIEFWS